MQSNLNHKIVRDDRRFHSRLSSREKSVAQTLSRQFRESIRIHNSHTFYWDHGYRAGDLHESNLWQIASGIDNARPFSVRESIDIPDFHIGILVDCSGSMNAHCTEGSSHSIMSASRSLALGLAMALDDMQGVHVSVCGHTEECGRVHLLMVKRANSLMEPANFGALTARSGNLDGLAIVAFAREMKKDMKEQETGMMVLISDGAPCHSEVIMKKAFALSHRQHGIKVLPIGVGSSLASSEEVCKTYYGINNYVLAPDVLSAAPRIVTKANSFISELKPM